MCELYSQQLEMHFSFKNTWHTWNLVQQLWPKGKVNKLENAHNFQDMFSDGNVIYLGKLTTEEEALDFSMLELHGGR